MKQQVLTLYILLIATRCKYMGANEDMSNGDGNQAMEDVSKVVTQSTEVAKADRCDGEVLLRRFGLPSSWLTVAPVDESSGAFVVLTTSIEAQRIGFLLRVLLNVEETNVHKLQGSNVLGPSSSSVFGSLVAVLAASASSMEVQGRASFHCHTIL